MEVPHKLSDEQLQNFLIKAEALINNRPLTEIPTHPWQPALTPNHFLLGSGRGAPSDTKEENEMEDPQTIYNRLLTDKDEQDKILTSFWDRWSKEYLPLIAARKKWKRTTEPLRVDDVVFICEPTGWTRGVIDEIFVDPETDQVREVLVRTTKRIYRRAATSIAKVEIPRNNNTTPTTTTTTEIMTPKTSGPVTRSQKLLKIK